MIDAVAKALMRWALPYNDWDRLTDGQREAWRTAAQTAVDAKDQWERANLTPADG